MLDYARKMCLKHNRGLMASHYGYVCEACENSGYMDDAVTSGGLQL